MITAVLWSGIAAGMLLLGMYLAYGGHVNARWTGLIMAFGAGALISAVAYQLVLGATAKYQGRFALVGLGIAAGALTFYFADRWVDRLGGGERKDFEGAQHGGSGTAILLGSLLDGVPESLVLGLSLAHSPQVSLALVFAVAASNIPEGIGGTTGMLAGGWPKPKIARLWLAVFGLSVLAAALGYWLGRSIPGISGALVDAFAAGSLLVMLTDAMIPESFAHGGNEAGLCLVLGYGAALAMALAHVA